MPNNTMTELVFGGISSEIYLKKQQHE